jgi:hypothetical protein
MYHVTPVSKFVVDKERDTHDLPTIITSMQQDPVFNNFLSIFLFRPEHQRATLFIAWICHVVHIKCPDSSTEARASLVHKIIQNSQSRQAAAAAFTKQFGKNSAGHGRSQDSRSVQ